MKSGLVYLITMAGRGLRFGTAGYELPKYMIEASGATLFEHSLGSLPLSAADRIVFVALKEHQEKYALKTFIASKLEKLCGGAAPEMKILLLEKPTGGQAQTALAAQSLVPDGCELAIYNIDTRFSSATLARRLADPALKKDGVIGAFKLTGVDPKWSFALTAADDTVLRTAEKEQISDNALTGFYHFTSARDFFRVAEAAVKNNLTERGEFYVAPLYNQLIREGRSFVLDTAESLLPLGTPEDLRSYVLDAKPDA